MSVFRTFRIPEITIKLRDFLVFGRMWEAGARSPQSILISWSNRSPYIQPPRLSISMVTGFY